MSTVHISAILGNLWFPPAYAQPVYYTTTSYYTPRPAVVHHYYRPQPVVKKVVYNRPAYRHDNRRGHSKNHHGDRHRGHR